MILLGIFAFSMIGIALSSIRESGRDEFEGRQRRSQRAFRRELRRLRNGGRNAR